MADQVLWLAGARQPGVCTAAEAAFQEGMLGPPSSHQIRIQGGLPAGPAPQAMIRTPSTKGDAYSFTPSEEEPSVTI